MSKSKWFIGMSYLLVFVGYMTLTISLPLIHQLQQGSNVSLHDVGYGLSILFLMFSCSAVVLSRLADFVGAYRILSFAQPFSIIGLFILSISHTLWTLLLGFFLVGLGTGCYSSIARLLVAKHTEDHHHMRKSFALFSILITLAPIASSHIALWSNLINWRWAYIIMMLIEIILLLAVVKVLRKEIIIPRPIKLDEVFHGYVYCLKKFTYVGNMLFIGITISIFIKLFIGNAIFLFTQQGNNTSSHLGWIISGMSIFYIMGIICFRILVKHVAMEKARIILLALLVLSVIWFAYSNTLFNLVASIYAACLLLGFISPLSTSAGLIVIDKNQGAAAALYTFSFALISSFWSWLQAHLMIPIKSFMLLSLICSISAMIIISIIFHLKARNHN